MQQITKAIIELEGAKKRLQQIHFITNEDENIRISISNIYMALAMIDLAIFKIKEHEKRETIKTNRTD